jgi:DNA-binding transcriptional LysR family regulator
LIQRLHTLAPRLSIRTITRVENQLEQLSQGNLDFALHIAQAHYPQEFKVHPIGSNPPAILVRTDHPLTQGEITWERLANYPVIRLYISDIDSAEVVRTSEAFKRVRNPSQGSLETSHLLTAIEVLRNTDYFLPGPAYILQNHAVGDGIVAVSAPQADSYSMDYVLVAHERTAHSPVHNWFWQQLTDIIHHLPSADIA